MAFSQCVNFNKKLFKFILNSFFLSFLRSYEKKMVSVLFNARHQRHTKRRHISEKVQISKSKIQDPNFNIQNPRWFQSCSIQGINIIPRDVTFSTRKIHVIDACQAAQPFIQPGFSSAISGLVGLPLSLVAGATRWLRW